MASKYQAKNLTTPQPDGEVRESQVVTTYGPGAMVDLIDHAVLIGGLDFWNYDGRRGGTQAISLPRLRDSLAERFKKLERSLRESNAFLHPPLGKDNDASNYHGIQVLEFPRWFVCQRESCRGLVRADGLELKGGRYVHACPGRSGGRPGECVPVRFVAACKNGHIDEFPWIQFVHQGRACASPDLQLLEGATGDFAEIRVRCQACRAQRRLIDAMIEPHAHHCRDTRPWLGEDATEPCDEKSRLLVRTASNGYFSLVASALSIPELGMGLREVSPADQEGAKVTGITGSQ